MQKIILSRGKGKTSTLIEMSAKTGYYMIVRTHTEANRVQESAKRLGFDIPLPITYWDFIKKNYYGSGIKGFLLDNLDEFLSYMTDKPILAVTMLPSTETENKTES
jgi:hypothetical protein